ncbi:CPBP family intramembrane glutamic endopeptidase [Gottfriedia sp. NPDC057991]|uniref:CPBP family intramembrane glutamic endopeptidase n=1 Tax=Gottfriedia sp. NPDC057991 TaxID=3346298 RepID=UPI0036DEC8A3
MKIINANLTLKFLLLMYLAIELSQILVFMLLAMVNININNGIMLFTQSLLLILPTLYLFKKYKIDWRKDLSWSKIPYYQYFYLAIFVILFQPFAYKSVTLIENILNIHTSPENGSFSYGFFVYALIFVGLLSPLYEEVWYRGVLFENTKHMGVRTAIIWNGLIFGLIHFDITALVYTFLFGMLCCYVVHKTKSLISSLFMHVLYNCLQLIPKKTSTESYFQFINNYTTILFCTLLLVLIIYLWNTNFNKNKKDNSIKEYNDFVKPTNKKTILKEIINIYSITIVILFILINFFIPN